MINDEGEKVGVYWPDFKFPPVNLWVLGGKVGGLRFESLEGGKRLDDRQKAIYSCAFCRKGKSLN